MKRRLKTLSKTALLLAICAGTLAVPAIAKDEAPARAEEAPLGGEALAQRKTDMQRALGDLGSFNRTLTSLIERRDDSGIDAMEPFVLGYIGRHLDALIAPTWPSNHPEMAAVDANLRFMKAELLIQLRRTRDVQRVIDDIRVRYEGRQQMLVDYPLGQQSTITDGIEKLKNSKWNG
jgi:hypothetical protein